MARTVAIRGESNLSAKSPNPTPDRRLATLVSLSAYVTGASLPSSDPDASFLFSSCSTVMYTSTLPLTTTKYASSPRSPSVNTFWPLSISTLDIFSASSTTRAWLRPANPGVASIAATTGSSRLPSARRRLRPRCSHWRQSQ